MLFELRLRYSETLSVFQRLVRCGFRVVEITPVDRETSLEDDEELPTRAGGESGGGDDGKDASGGGGKGGSGGGGGVPLPFQRQERPSQLAKGGGSVGEVRRADEISRGDEELRGSKDKPLKQQAR